MAQAGGTFQPPVGRGLIRGGNAAQPAPEQGQDRDTAGGQQREVAQWGQTARHVQQGEAHEHSHHPERGP